MGPAAVLALGQAKDVVGKVVRSKWFWIALVVVILFFVIRKKWNRIEAALRPDRGDYSDVLPSQVPEYRRKELEDLAEDLHKKTKGNNFWSWLSVDSDDRRMVMWKCLQLPDGELAYLAKYYRQALNPGVRLSTVIDGEAVYGDYDEDLAIRLEKIGE